MNGTSRIIAAVDDLFGCVRHQWQTKVPCLMLAAMVLCILITTLRIANGVTGVKAR